MSDKPTITPQLRIAEAEEYLSQVWGRPAYVLLSRVGGGGYVRSATDHNGHHLRLSQDWDGYGHEVVCPVSGVWPEH